MSFFSFTCCFLSYENIEKEILNSYYAHFDITLSKDENKKTKLSHLVFSMQFQCSFLVFLSFFKIISLWRRQSESN